MARPLLLLPLALLVAACTGGGDGAADDSPLGQLRRMGEAAEAAGEAAQEMQERQESGRPAVEPVDFRRLRELMPEEAGGLARTNLEGSRNGAMGMTVSVATATYAGESGDGSAPSLTLSVTDLGGMGGAAMFGAAWTLAEVDSESERGYERTTEIDGHPGFVKFDHQDRSGDFQAFVAERFLVQVQGRNVTEDQLQDALRSVSFDALDDMRDEGR